MRDFAAYLLYRASSAVIAALPLALVFRIGEWAGALAWLLSPQYRRLAFRNASIALEGEESPSDVRRMVRLHFRRLGANLLSSIKVSTMPPEEIEQRVEIQNIDAMGREFRAGVPVVLLLSHLSNWELFSQLMPRCFPFIRSSSVYQRLSNRLMDAHVRQTRSRTGLELFDRSEGFQPVIDLLRSGGGVGILSDQHAGDNGLWTPLFGKLASTSPLAALLAKRTKAALLAAAVYTEGVARWRMVFTERIDEPGASVEALTLKANALLEQQIRAAPEDWFWAGLPGNG
jgi:lauroyl/myristoyl acyltransferase